MTVLNAIICPGCGWVGTIETLQDGGCCPECNYENGVEPNRLLTLSEMMEDSTMEYVDVRMDLFLKSLLTQLLHSLLAGIEATGDMKKSVYRQSLDVWLIQQGYSDIGELKRAGWVLLSFVQFLEMRHQPARLLS